jgi:DNA-binding FadR family transcriptional regulator
MNANCGGLTGMTDMKSKNNQHSVQRLRELLQSGHYLKEGRLPPERELSVELGISRTALRKALSVLEAENLIWRHVGRGTFVGSRTMGKHAARFLAAEITNPAEIMEVRMVFEPKMAAIAALRATPGNLEQMTNALVKSEAATDPLSFEVWDGALHLTIAASTGNSLLISFFDAINSLREDKLWGRLKEASFNRSRHQSYCRQHRKLVVAIMDRDAVTAEQVMRTHLESVQKNLLGNL